MEIVKKNIISIICGVVALAAVVVAFVIVPGHKEAAPERTSTPARRRTRSLDDLLKKPRQLPVVNPDNPEQKSLEAFPSEAVIKQGEAITKKVEEESKAIFEAAVEMNKHELLVPGSLPAPFAAAAVRVPPRVQRRAAAARPRRPARAAAGRRRDEVELRQGAQRRHAPDGRRGPLQASETLAKEIETKEAGLHLAGPAGQRSRRSQAEIDERTQQAPDGDARQDRDDVEGLHQPDTFEVNPRDPPSPAAPRTPLDIYFAQLSYWIQQDVVQAVNEMNANVQEHRRFAGQAPDPHPHQAVRQRRPVLHHRPGSAPPPPTPTPLCPRCRTVSTTGRVSNGLYDVFHFEMEADVEADKLPDFLRGLGTKRFITPLFVDVKAKDNAHGAGRGARVRQQAGAQRPGRM